MAVTPETLVFNYKKGNALPPGHPVFLKFDYAHQHTGNITCSYTGADWLNVPPDYLMPTVNYDESSGSSSSSSHSKTVYLSLKDVKDLDIGEYSVTVKFFNSYPDYHFSINDDRSTIMNDFIGELTVVLNVGEAFLTISPGNLSYNHVIGRASVESQKIKITSDSDWTADFTECEWIPLDIVNGVAGTDKELTINVAPDGLTEGDYTQIVTFTNTGGASSTDDEDDNSDANPGGGVGEAPNPDGYIPPVSTLGTSTSLEIKLEVSSSSQGTGYCTPTDLLFNYTISGNLPPSKRIELNVSKEWTATTEDAWLLLGTTKGDAGVGFFDVSIQEVTEFAVGEYSGAVKLTAGSVEKLINVVLVVRSFTKETLSEKTLYFSDDQNNIVISSEGTATYLAIDVLTEYNNETFKYPSAVPFFKGTAKKRIGAVVNKVINNEPDLVLDTISLKTPYLPALLTIDVQEAEIYSDEVIEGVKLNKIPFVKGITPFDNWLSDNTKEMYLTNKGVVSFNFFNPLLTAVTEIEITGSINKTVTFPAVSSYFNTVKIPLNLLDLKEGDAIIITAHNTIVTVFIKPNTPDNALVFWENKWGVFDSLEFTGDFSEKDNYKSKDFSYRKDHLTTETKVLSVINKINFKLNTGPLYTYESIDAVSKMLKSKNIKLIYQDEIIAVKSTTKTLSRPKISENNKSFNLTFEKLIK
ncbi:hypothetical protein [Tenacibaculum dicentrarchi]|uniref:hypothetical protein n=1 Tax=Tenacibaculum dicentrarchi TaxID=669041 RepID=UPI0035131EFC